MPHDDEDHHHEHNEHGSELSEMQLRVRALETILTEKGYVDRAALDLIVEAFETRIGPHNGARAVAKAWADPAFRKALLADASAAVGSLGISGRVGDHLVAVGQQLDHRGLVGDQRPHPAGVGGDQRESDDGPAAAAE